MPQDKYTTDPARNPLTDHIPRDANETDEQYEARSRLVRERQQSSTGATGPAGPIHR